MAMNNQGAGFTYVVGWVLALSLTPVAITCRRDIVAVLLSFQPCFWARVARPCPFWRFRTPGLNA